MNKENEETINKELIELAEEYIRFRIPKNCFGKFRGEKQTFLGQIINTYVRKDIRDIGNIRNISAFNKLLVPCFTIRAITQCFGDFKHT